MHTPDVIVIGGGVIGLAVADRLAGDGRRVALLEAGACGSEASWAGAGILAPCSWHRRDELARMHRDALQRYEAFALDLRERTGIDPQHRRCGALRLINDLNRLHMAQRESAAASGHTTPAGQPVVQTLTMDQARALEPGLAADIQGAQHCRLTAQVRNPRLLAALQSGARQRGVCIREQTPARGLVRTGGTVCGVDTDEGRVLAGVTVLCAGAWSAQIDAELAPAVPIYPVRGQIILLQCQPAPIGMIIEDGKHYLVPREDGHVLVGSTEEHFSGFDKRNTAAGIRDLTRFALHRVPGLARAAVLRSWAGLRPAAPDRRPVIGEAPEFRGLLVCTGHFRAGLTAAPVAAGIIADLVDHQSCEYDLTACRPGRFAGPAGL
jgi:glycine oxidase